jgi:precorrin-6B methylase 2
VRAWLAFFVCAAVAAAGACGKGSSEGDPPARGSDDLAREQARFDAERKPETIVAALGIGPGSRVADIGAGSGLITVHLARAVAPDGHVVATDVDGSVLGLLAKRMDAMGLSKLVERKVVAADAPGLDRACCDAILLAEVDQYFADPVAWLKAAIPALKPGGKIVIENRNYHRMASLAAARKAGLIEGSETTPVPTHFIAIFTAPEAP